MPEQTTEWEAPKRGEAWEAPEPTKSRELVLTTQELVSQGKPAYEAYSKELILLAKQTLLPPEGTEADLYYLFQLAGKYQLDPFAKEIWLIPMKRKNAAGNWEKHAVPLIGRDGMLALAERNPRYLGIRAAVVHDKDEYEVLAEPRILPNGCPSYVRHRCIGFGSGARGAVLGAWCEVYQQGRETVLFEAEIGQYLPGNLNDFSPWKNQPDVMTIKCAIVNALRQAVRVSGVYVDAEMDKLLELGTRHELREMAGEPVVPIYPDDPWWEEYLRALFDAAEAARPGSYPSAKQALLLDAAMGAENTEEALNQLAADLTSAITRTGAPAPAPPPPVEDAVVVDEGIEFGDAPVEEHLRSESEPPEQPTLLSE